MSDAESDTRPDLEEMFEQFRQPLNTSGNLTIDAIVKGKKKGAAKEKDLKSLNNASRNRSSAQQGSNKSSTVTSPPVFATLTGHGGSAIRASGGGGHSVTKLGGTGKRLTNEELIMIDDELNYKFSKKGKHQQWFDPLAKNRQSLMFED